MSSSEKNSDDAEDVKEKEEGPIRRITVGWGWAIHAVVFEFGDGRRSGRLLANNDVPMDLTDTNLKQRGGENWKVIDNDDTIINVSGHSLTGNSYLCYDLNFITAKGKTISFTAEQAKWKGKPFTFKIEDHQILSGIHFAGGSCIGITTLVS